MKRKINRKVKGTKPKPPNIQSPADNQSQEASVETQENQVSETTNQDSSKSGNPSIVGNPSSDTNSNSINPNELVGTTSQASIEDKETHFDFIETGNNLIKLISGLVGLTYMLGFFITNVNLLTRYGIYDFAILKARYIYIGIFF